MNAYTPKIPARAHQVQALEAMEGRDWYGLRMAMRTGKTKTTLDDFARLYVAGEVDDLMVIAPAGVYETWIKAMDEHLGEPLAGDGLIKLVWRAKDKGKGAQAREGAFMAPTVAGELPRALLVNIEALSNVARARALVAEFTHQRRCYVVVDESTAIKNPSAQRTKFLVKQVGPLAAFRRILTGLISPQGPLDVWSQFEFLSPGALGFRTFSAFKSMYAVTRRMEMGGRWFDMVVGYKNEEDLARRVAEHSFRVRLEDCYDMPESDYSQRVVEMTDEQRKIYAEMKAYATTKLEGEANVTATIALTQILRLHQILCGHVVDEEGTLHEVSNNRTSAVLEILEEYDGKAIIWCAYDHSVRDVAQALGKRYGNSSVARFWGGNRDSREAEEIAFQTDPECRFMVATASAGGKGRMWAGADLVIYHSSTANLEHRAQSEERAKNVGKTRMISYIDLVTPGTVDQKIIEALKKKESLAAIISGDNWKEFIR